MDQVLGHWSPGYLKFPFLHIQTVSSGILQYLAYHRNALQLTVLDSVFCGAKGATAKRKNQQERVLPRAESRASLQRPHTKLLLQRPAGKIPFLCFIVCCENKPNYETVESRSQTSNLLAKEEPLRLGAHSTHCFCFLFLDSMTPTRPTAARPTPVMPMILVASLTWSLRATP